MATTPNIASIAKKYVGQREIPNNAGFKNSDFQKKMEAVGFLKGQAWCAYFAELVWKEAYTNNTPESVAVLKVLDKLFAPSATATYKNFDLDPNKNFKVSQTPVVGAVVIWRHGTGWQGHAGIVTGYSAGSTTFETVEGNTNSAGGREGIEVAVKTRKLNLPLQKDGLNLVGFIIPKAI